MENQPRHDPATIDGLTRALYGIAGIRRDLRRRAGIEHVPVGLTALGSIHRVGPARVSDIAHDLQVDLSVASRQVQALEAEGLVDRVPDPHDRRSSLVALSVAGREKLGRVHQRLADALQDALSAWEPATVEALVEGLLRLRDDLATCPSHPVDRVDAPPARGPEDHPAAPGPIEEQRV